MAALGLAGCGAEEAKVVKGAFDRGVDSADVKASMSFTSTRGNSGMSLEGPFKSNGEGEVPSFDWQVSLGGVGGVPATEGRLISSGKNIFVEYRGEMYELGEDIVAEMTEPGGEDDFSTADLQKLMRTMGDWFPESDAQESTTLDGEPVTRVTGRLDLSKALEDIKRLSEQGRISGFEGLTDADIKAAERNASDPKFTIDVGREDGKLRRILASIKVSEGSDSGTLKIDIRFRDVDKPVQIDAPTSGRPIEELGDVIMREHGAGSAETTIS